MSVYDGGAADMKPAVFFDRDGVLNRDVHYLYKVEDFVWVEGAMAAIRWANRRGYWVFVVTNQSGVARGYYAEADVRRLHAWMNERLGEYGAKIDDFFYCPHYIGGMVAQYAVACDCRKPQAGLLRQAQERYAVDMARSVMIGDKASDMECARAAGVRGVLFQGGDLCTALQAALFEA